MSGTLPVENKKPKYLGVIGKDLSLEVVRLGVETLPLGMPVEIELILEVR